MDSLAENGGERGIRTPGGLTLNGFQDRRIKPLCHLSEPLIMAYHVEYFVPSVAIPLADACTMPVAGTP